MLAAPELCRISGVVILRFTRAALVRAARRVVTRTVDGNLCITVLSERSRREWSKAVTQSAVKSSKGTNQTSRHFRHQYLPSPPLRSSTSMQDIGKFTEGLIRILPGFYNDGATMGSVADRCLACNALERPANPSIGRYTIHQRNNYRIPRISPRRHPSNRRK